MIGKDPWAWFELAVYLIFLSGGVIAFVRSLGWQRNLVISVATKANLAILLIVGQHVFSISLASKLLLVSVAIAVFLLLEAQFPSWGFPPKSAVEEHRLTNPRNLGFTQLLLFLLVSANLVCFALSKGPVYPPLIGIGATSFFVLTVGSALLVRWHKTRNLL